jgi:hypothetical protein
MPTQSWEDYSCSFGSIARYGFDGSIEPSHEVGPRVHTKCDHVFFRGTSPYVLHTGGYNRPSTPNLFLAEMIPVSYARAGIFPQ